jgi:hypothetical protein
VEYLDIIKQIGFPSAVLVFVGIGLWRILVWVGNSIVIPIKDAHVKLVESAQKSNELNADTLQKMAKLLETNENRDQATYTLVVETHEIVKGLKVKG